MQVNRTEVLESLVVSNVRLTRAAARATGNTVASAVWSTLGVLTAEGPRRIGDLARAARISQPGMTKVVQNLVHDEWVLRVADVDDSRAWLIAVTDAGRRALADWRLQLAESMDHLFDDLTEAEWATLAAASAILAAHTRTTDTTKKEVVA